MIAEQNFKFSFSGLKTAVLYYIERITKVGGNQKSRNLTKQEKADIAMSFENAVVDVLATKALRACKKYDCKTVSLSGGVAANTSLRESLKNICAENKIAFSVPDFQLCTDNAQMIALAAYFNLRNGKKPVLASKVKVDPSWEVK